MTAARHAFVHDGKAVMEALEKAGWRTYGRVAAEVSEVTEETLQAVERSARSHLFNLGIKPAVFFLSYRKIKPNSHIVMWNAAAPAKEEQA